NALVDAPNCFTVAPEHLKLVLYGGQIAPNITGITILGNQLERNLFAIAPDQHRDMGFLDPFGLIDCATHLIIFPFERCFLLSPQSSYHLERLAQIAQAGGSVGVLIPIGVVFLPCPSSSHTQGESSMRE